jgi:hypothetical protein
MTRTILVTIALLLMLDTAGAVRVLDQVERAVELTLGDLTLPASDGGTVSFSECPKCGISTHRVTNETIYQANGQILPLGEFLRVAAEIRQRSTGNSGSVAAVFLDIETERVTRVEIRE